MKPWQTIPIMECSEKLRPIPDGPVLLTQPPPYMALGAPYHGTNPWFLREGVLAALLAAQRELETRLPGRKLLIFDAYRPNTVQQFMVDREFTLLSGGRTPDQVPPPERAALQARVLRIWAMPSDDPTTPPPHNTGAVLDLTMADAAGREIPMGSPIDENSDRSTPDYFKESAPLFHQERELLHAVMRTQGFRRHPAEWWHFSLGDQMWAYAERQTSANSVAVARYGRADPFS